MCYNLPSLYIKEAIEKQNTEIITVTEPSDLKLRPTVKGPNCPTRKLINLIDILSKPFIKLSPVSCVTCVRDSTDSVKKCQGDVNVSTKIVTLDVINLYTNIQHDLGLEAINYLLLLTIKTCSQGLRKNFS